MLLSRKVFLGHAAAAGVALTARGVPAGRAAGHKQREQNHVPRPRLSASETATLGAWCDLLVRGASANGVGDFVNTQLAKHPDDALLGIRYFDWAPPYLPFYRDALAALDTTAVDAFGRSFKRLSREQQAELHQRLSAGDAPWDVPAPFSLFYLVTRSDAVDVGYGTPEGHARIDFPYVPQVAPPTRW